MKYVAKTYIILWTNDNLAIDGVIINKFVMIKYMEVGELNPPGGWKGFIPIYS